MATAVTSPPRSIATRISVVVKPITPSRGAVICKNATDMIAKTAPAPTMIPFTKDDNEFEDIRYIDEEFDLRIFRK